MYTYQQWLSMKITKIPPCLAGFYRICYASPELLLHNNNFKKLYQKEKFQRRIIVFAVDVDEAHVIEHWKDSFRKDYDELQTLKVISGTEILWMALMATCTTVTPLRFKPPRSPDFLQKSPSSTCTTCYVSGTCCINCFQAQQSPLFCNA